MFKITDFINISEIPFIYRKDLQKLYPKEFKKFIKAINKVDKNSLFIFGVPGTGKTLNALVYVFRKLKHRDEIDSDDFGFYNVPKLLFNIRQSFKKEGPKENLTEEESILYKCCDKKFIILDDMGVEKATDFSFQTLYLIINYRYENNKPTIITSNLDIDTLYEEMEDNRIISRIQAMCQLIHCKKQYRNV